MCGIVGGSTGAHHSFYQWTSDGKTVGLVYSPYRTPGRWVFFKCYHDGVADIRSADPARLFSPAAGRDFGTAGISQHAAADLIQIREARTALSALSPASAGWSRTDFRKRRVSHLSNSKNLKTFIQISFAVMLAPLCYGASGTSSLDALVAEAMARNPEVNAYVAEIAAARGERRTAGEWKNPEVTTDVGSKLVRDFDGNSIGNGPLWTVSATQAFEYPGRIALRKAIANHQIALAELGLEGFRTALATRVRSIAFRAALSEQESKRRHRGVQTVRRFVVGFVGTAGRRCASTARYSNYRGQCYRGETPAD